MSIKKDLLILNYFYLFSHFSFNDLEITHMEQHNLFSKESAKELSALHNKFLAETVSVLFIYKLLVYFICLFNLHYFANV